ncbi:MAG: D-alanine--D-alanine ligase [Endomicrobiia bacterium]
MKKLKIAILYGGFSSERIISIKTGKAIYNALSNSSKYIVELIDLNKQNYIDEILKLKTKKVDLAFIALHGRFGEDGELQAILESLNIKYTGCSFLASCLAMNKHFSKCIFLANKIPTAPWILVNKGEKVRKVVFPIVIKPVNEGSTIGVTIAENYHQFEEGVKNAFKYDNKIILEKYIKGREFTVPILGDEILPLVEIKPNLNKYYDFDSKYKVGGSEHIIPPEIDKKIYKKIEEVGYKAAKSIGYEVVCRVDIILQQKTNIPYVLEINTIPGMTPVSLLPEAAKYRGIDFQQLVEKIISLSLDKYKK